jgi:hypothetical protein
MERDDVAPQRKACFSVDCPGLVDNHCHKYVPNALSPAKPPIGTLFWQPLWIVGSSDLFRISIFGFRVLLKRVPWPYMLEELICKLHPGQRTRLAIENRWRTTLTGPNGSGRPQIEAPFSDRFFKTACERYRGSNNVGLCARRRVG